MLISALIIISAILFLANTPIGKGYIGEFFVNRKIKLNLNSDEYQLLKNITLQTLDGTTQIDHIVVCQYGIFVIETKNYKGWIFGDEFQKMWTQKFPRHSSRFQNPLHQNFKHVKTLIEALSVEAVSVYSLVVFVGGAEFKTNMPSNVIYLKDLISYIKSKNDIIFDVDMVKNIIQSIHTLRLVQSIKTNVDHASHVREIVKQKSSNAISLHNPRIQQGSSSQVSKTKKKNNSVLVFALGFGLMIWIVYSTKNNSQNKIKQIYAAVIEKQNFVQLKTIGHVSAGGGSPEQLPVQKQKKLELPPNLETKPATSPKPVSLPWSVDYAAMIIVQGYIEKYDYKMVKSSNCVNSVNLAYTAMTSSYGDAATKDYRTREALANGYSLGCFVPKTREDKIPSSLKEFWKSNRSRISAEKSCQGIAAQSDDIALSNVRDEEKRYWLMKLFTEASSINCLH